MNSKSKFANKILVVSLAMPAGLCAQQSQRISPSTINSANNNATPTTTVRGETEQGRPVPAQRNPRYRINRSDILSLTFPLTPEFNQPKVMVQPDGYVTLQGAGSVYIQGLTVPETVEAVKQAYSKTLHDPIVDIDLIDFQKAYFVVLGQVSKPGQYDLRYDMTVTEAIALAGGFAATAKTQVFLYHRVPDGGWLEARELKLNDILHGKNVAEDTAMRPGDMIFVPEKTITKIRKYVPYGVGTSVSTSPASYF